MTGYVNPDDRSKSEQLARELACSQTMQLVLEQCLRYARLAKIDVESILRPLRETGELPVRDKKEGKRLLELLRESLGEAVGDVGRIMSEKDRSQNGRERRLIRTEKKGRRILPGAPVCQDFDETYFYYTSCVSGCPYDCEYCYLKGKYASDDLIVYTDIDETFRELECLLEDHEVYLCISYDTDLLALEDITGYVKQWMTFTESHPGLRVECRTKCDRTDIFRGITPCDRMIFAFTLSPEEVIREFEHHTPTLEGRLTAIRTAMEAGHPVRLCFDPMLAVPGWRRIYEKMLDMVMREVDLKQVRDFSVGTFRIPQDFLKQLRRREPASLAVQYPFVGEGGVWQYPAKLRQAMTSFLSDRLRKAAPEVGIYLPEEIKKNTCGKS